MNPLQPGTPVPPLKLLALDGEFDQSSVLDSPTILYFMRSTNCGICLGHVQAIAKKLAGEVRPDVQVFVVVPEEPKTARKLVSRVPFPVLSGADGAYEAVGLGKRFGVVQGSGSLLLEPGGKVAFFKPGTLPTQAYDEVGLFGALQGLAPGATR